MILSGTQPWAGALLVAFMVFAGLTLAYVIFSEDLKERRQKAAKRPAAEPLVDFARNTAKLLNSTPASHVSSVIEDTTELLPLETKSSKL